MHTHHGEAGHLVDHGFHDPPRRFDQVDSHLLEQVSSLLGWERCDQLLFCHGQDTLEPDDEKIADQVSVNILGPPTHVILFKAGDSFAHGRFDFSLCLHTHLARAKNTTFYFTAGSLPRYATKQGKSVSWALLLHSTLGG